MSAAAQSLVDLTAARKYAALSHRSLLECIAEGAGSVAPPAPSPPVAPTAPVLSLSAFMIGVDSYLSPAWTASADPALDFLFCYGTTPGGPYPNCISFGASTRSGIVPGVVSGTHYYGVIYARNSISDVSAASNEGNATPTPPIVGFSFAPATAGGSYNSGTPFSDLANFQAVDPATITELTLNDVTSVSNLVSLPNLTSFTVNNTIESLGSSIDFIGCGNLQRIDLHETGYVGALDVSPCAASLIWLGCGINSELTSVNVTGCSSLVTLIANLNDTMSDIFGLNTCTDLVTLNCSSNALTSLNFSGLANLQTVDCSQNNLTGALVLSDLPAVVDNINVSGNPNLTAITANNLVTVNQDLIVSFCASLAALSVNSLVTVTGNFDLENTAIVNASFPALVTAGTPTINSLHAQANTAMLTFSAPNIVDAATIQLDGNTSLQSVSLTNLASADDITAVGCTSLLSFDIPTAGFHQNGSVGIIMNGCTSLISVSFGAGATFAFDFNLSGCTSLASVSIPGATLGQMLNCSGCSMLATMTLGAGITLVDNPSLVDFRNDILTQSSVDAILASGVASGVTLRDFELNSPGNSAPSNPAGLADKATLIGLGNTVVTN